MIFLCRHHLSNRPRSCPFALCSVLCRTDSGRVDCLAWRHPAADSSPNVPSDFPGGLSLLQFRAQLRARISFAVTTTTLALLAFPSRLAHIALNAAAAFLFVLSLLAACLSLFHALKRARCLAEQVAIVLLFFLLLLFLDFFFNSWVCVCFLRAAFLARRALPRALGDLYRLSSLVLAPSLGLRHEADLEARRAEPQTRSKAIKN